MINKNNVWEIYAQAYNHFYAKSLLDLHKGVASKIKTGSVIDLGCGVGKLLTHIKPKNYLGVEASLEMLSYAHKNFGETKGVEFVKGDIRTYDIKEIFDNIVMINVLYALENSNQCIDVLSKVSNSMNSSSRFLFSNLNPSLDLRKLEKLIESDCSKQIVSIQDKEKYDLFLECNKFLGEQNKTYKPLVFDKSQLGEILSASNLYVVDTETQFGEYFNGMCDLILCSKKH